MISLLNIGSFVPALNERGHDVLRRGEALMTSEEAQQQFMAQAEPQEEHRWLQKLVGEWTYEATATMGPDKPPESMHGAVTARPLGGLWVVVEERGDPARSDVRTNIITLGYSLQKQRFVGTFVDSGSTFLWVYDGSLAGNVLTLESEGPAMAGPGTATYRDVKELVNDDHFVLRSLAPGENGKWHEFMTSHYRRK
jgi:hypothetical protein